MTEPTNPENKGEGTSPTSGKPAGTFGPPNRRVDSITPPKGEKVSTTDLEKMRKLERFSEKVDYIIKYAKNLLSDAKELLPQEGYAEIESMISELESFKVDVEKDYNTFESCDGEADKIEEILRGVQKQIFGLLNNGEVEVLQEKNRNEKITLLSRQQTRYLKLLSSIETIRKSNISDTTLQEDTLRTADELNWLSESEKTEEFAREAELEKLVEIKTSVDTLTEKLEEALMLLKKENEEREQTEIENKAQENIKTRTADISRKYQELRDEVGGLKIIDTALHSQIEEKEGAIAKVRGKLKGKPSQKNLDDFIKLVTEYEELLPELRSAVVATITPPSFLSRSISNQEDPAPTPDSTPAKTTEQLTDRAPDDIGISNIRETKESLDRNNDSKEYEILIDGKNILVPKVFLGTLNRYTSALKNPALSGKDFSRATRLKEEVLHAIEGAEFDFADRKARALGEELNIIEGVTAVTDPSKAPNRNVGDITGSFESGYEIQTKSGLHPLRNPKVPETIMKYEEMSNDPKYVGYDFTLASQSKDAVIAKLVDDDFAQAKFEAMRLGDELRKIELAVNDAVAKENSRRGLQRSPKDINLPEISENKKAGSEENRYKIRINGKFETVPLSALHTLNRYKKIFENQAFKSENFTSAITLKDAVLDAIQTGDFTTAKKKADLLTIELNRITKENSNQNSTQENQSAKTGQEPSQLEKNKKFNNPPVGEIVSLLTKDRYVGKQVEYRAKNNTSAEREIINDLKTWEKKWLLGGAIDTYREKNGNIKISDAQVRTTKLILQTYKQLLEQNINSEVNTDVMRTVPQNIIICTQILAGIHNETKSDIKYLVEHYSERADDALLQKLRSYFIAQPHVTHKQLSSIENSNLEKRFLLLGNTLKDGDTVLQTILPYITSTEERSSLLKLSSELKTLEEEIKGNKTLELIESFKKKLDVYLMYVTKKAAVLQARYGAQNIVPQPTVSPKNITVMRSKRLRGDGPKTETLEEYDKREKLEKVVTDAKNSDEHQENQDELRKKHQEMFARDPDLYKHIYGGGNKVRDDVTEKISSEILPSKSAQTPKEYLIALIKEKEVLEKKWQAIYDDIAKGTAVGNPTGEAKVLRAQIELLDLRIAKYTKVILDDQIHKPEHSSFVTNKMVYSPTDEVQPTPGAVNIGRELLTNREEIEALGKEQVNVATSVLPHHQSGLISTLTPQQAGIAEGAIHLEPGAMDNTDLERYKTENPEAKVVSVENKQERQTFVQKLVDVLFTFPKVRMNKWGWLAAGLTTAAVGGAAAYTVGTVEKNNRPKTIAELIKNQPSWETFINENVPKQFILNFNGPKALPFDEFIKVSAPSFAIGPNNPSAKDKIANLLCKDVYDVEGANSGLTELQQRESAEIVKNLQEIIKATKAPSGVLYEKDARFFGDMTIRQLYEVARKIAADATTEKARLGTK